MGVSTRYTVFDFTRWLAAASLLGACSTIATNTLDDGVSCPTGTKLCSALKQCVKLDDPNTGCGNASCEPCGGVSGAAKCVDQKCETAGPWSCVGKVVWSKPDPSVPASISFKVLKLIGQAPFEGLKVLTCPAMDFSCEKPISEATSDADGVIRLRSYKGFVGNYFAAPPPSYPNMAPQILYVLPPADIDEPELRKANMNILSTSDLKTIATIAGKTITPGTGTIVLAAHDCTGATAAGVSVQVDTITSATTFFYMGENGLPSQSLGATSSRGEAGILNIPPGYVTVTFTSDTAGKIGVYSVLVAADQVTGMGVGPTPL